MLSMVERDRQIQKIHTSHLVLLNHPEIISQQLFKLNTVKPV